MGEPVQKPPHFHLLVWDNNISVAASRSGCHNVLVKGKGYEDDNGQEIDNGRESAHCFWAAKRQQHPLKNRGMAYVHLNLPNFGHVFAFQASGHESWSQPSYETVCGCKCDSTESQRGNQGFAITLKGVGNDC